MKPPPNSSLGPASPDYGSWKAEGQALLIEYSSSMLESIGGAVMAAFQEAAGVGAETGGALFGTHGPDSVQLIAWRPVPLERAGSRIGLSPHNQLALQRLLAAAGTDPALKGLQPAGWMQSTLRRQIELAGESLEIYRRFFPEPWQVALLIRPSFQRATMAGFFFRERDGAIRTRASHREFVLLPAGWTAPSRPAAPVSAIPLPEPPGEPPRAQAPGAIPPRARWLRRVTVVLGAMAVVVLGVVGLMEVAPTGLQAPAVRVSEVADQLRIEWDADSEPAKSAPRAALVIQDAGRKTEKTLERNDLAAGSFIYQRQGADVLVQLSFERPGKAPVVETTRFIGPVVAPLAQLESMKKKVTELEDALAKSEAALNAERTRNAALERALKLSTASEPAPPAPPSKPPQ